MLTCTSLLAPLGDHRKTHINPSKGRKRKRKSKDDRDGSTTPPPPPEIGHHILIGINSVTRHLETLAARNAPSTMPASTDEHETTEKASDDLRPISMVLITHPKPSTSIAHAHLPTLVHLSTLNPASNPNTTRLVPLATSTDARLSSTLHIPRIGALAILSNAPGAKALEDFVREKVDTTSCPWIDEAMAAQWRGINVKSETSFVVRTKEKETAQVKAAQEV